MSHRRLLLHVFSITYLCNTCVELANFVPLVRQYTCKLVRAPRPAPTARSLRREVQSPPGAAALTSPLPLCSPAAARCDEPVALWRRRMQCVLPRPAAEAGWALSRLGLRFDRFALLSGNSAVLWSLSAPRVRLCVCAGGSWSLLGLSAARS